MIKHVCAPQECALCMACANICPQKAISSAIDENGFEKIVIDMDECIDCGLCSKVCAERSNVNRYEPIRCYAGQAINKHQLSKSASGGAFQMLAESVLEQGGVCYGCTQVKESGMFRAKHYRVHSMEELPKILNSKYIPSSIGDAFKKVLWDLKEQKLVLFSGTPCQIQGLKAFLGKEYDNLLTVDLICHGVTATRMFNDYVKELEKWDDIQIIDYFFRDKSVSWGTNFCYSYQKNGDKSEKIKMKHCPREESSYMIHYLKGNIFRENCYACNLSNIYRVSDFTLGDYWEIEMEHPEFITKKKPNLVLRRGVSCIMVNTEKAKRFVPEIETRMIMHEVTLESITAHNGNLRTPSKRGEDRDELLKDYCAYGYEVIERNYRNTVGKKMYLYRMKNVLKSYLPDSVRIFIYRTPFLRRIVFH